MRCDVVEGAELIPVGVRHSTAHRFDVRTRRGATRVAVHCTYSEFPLRAMIAPTASSAGSSAPTEPPVIAPALSALASSPRAAQAARQARVRQGRTKRL